MLREKEKIEEEIRCRVRIEETERRKVLAELKKEGMK